MMWLRQNCLLSQQSSCSCHKALSFSHWRTQCWRQDGQRDACLPMVSTRKSVLYLLLSAPLALKSILGSSSMGSVRLPLSSLLLRLVSNCL